MIELDIIKEIVENIANARQTSDWKTILNHAVFEKRQKSEKKYPGIAQLFSREDIEAIRDGLDLQNPNTPLEKLFYAALWKNGDLSKLSHLIDGVKNAPNNSKAVTFYHFGKFLVEPKENPIIDQHVIRAYKLVREHGRIDQKLINEISKSGLLTIRDSENYKNYMTWVKDRHITCPQEDKVELFQNIDDVMFALGRMIKSRSTTKT